MVLDSFGTLSSHMLQHIVLMNVVVPLWAFCAPSRFRPAELWRSWPWATALQVMLLWGWHAPGILPLVMDDAGLMLLMHASLVVCAAWFWLAIATMPRDGSWRSIFALLVTGKLFCLLGALLVFAPNTLFELAFSAHHHHGTGPGGLADQQTAGMLMLIACPLTYVGAGILLASRWFLSLETGSEANG